MQKTKKMNKKTAVIAATAVAVLVLIIILAISFGRKSTGGKAILYASADKSFTFTYPEDWILSETKGQNMGFDASKLIPKVQKKCAPDPQNNIPVCNDMIFFGTMEHSGDVSINSIEDVKNIASDKFGWSKDKDIIKDFKAVTVGGKKAIRFSVSGEAGKSMNEFVWIPLGGSKIMSFTAAFLDSDQKKDFERIISAVKFK